MIHSEIINKYYIYLDTQDHPELSPYTLVLAELSLYVEVTLLNILIVN